MTRPPGGLGLAASLSADQSHNCPLRVFPNSASPRLPPPGKPWQAGLSQASVYKIISFLCPQPPLVTRVLHALQSFPGHGKCDFTPQGFSAFTTWHWRKKKKKEHFCPFRVEKAPTLLTPSPESGPEAPRGSADGQVASLPPQTMGVLKGRKGR